MSGIVFEYFEEIPYDMKAITDEYEFEDGGKSFNRRTSTPPRRWVLRTMPNLDLTTAGYFKTFWETKGIDVTFSFLDRAGTTHNNVRFESFTCTHEGRKTSMFQAIMTIVLYP